MTRILSICSMLCVLSVFALTRPDFDRMWAAKKAQSSGSGAAIDVTDFSIVLNRDDWQTVTLSWHSASVKIIVCTNKYWSQSNEHWFALSASTASPYVHNASAFESAYYRIISGSYTSRYDVGKMTENIKPGDGENAADSWFSCPFLMADQTYQGSIGAQLPYSEEVLDTINQQEVIGGGSLIATYYIGGVWSDFGSEVGRILPGYGYLLTIDATKQDPIKLTFAGTVPWYNITNTISVPVGIYAANNWIGAPTPAMRLYTYNGITTPITQDGYTDTLQEQYPIGGGIVIWYYDSGVWDDFSEGTQCQRPMYMQILYTDVGETSSSTWVCPATRNENTPVLYE